MRRLLSPSPLIYLAIAISVHFCRSETTTAAAFAPAEHRRRRGGRRRGGRRQGGRPQGPCCLPAHSTSSDKLFSESVYDTIQNGKIAGIPDFLPPSFVEVLQRDAAALHGAGHFSTDALASYGTSSGKQFDPSRDRAVLKLQQWKNSELGDAATRARLAARLRELRSDLAVNLDRPGLVRGASASATQFGDGSTEISYTRFGPGAFLQRHVDEHHEELKGAAGWSTPTRRSLSWLVYLNRDWNPDKSGGALRCYERSAVASPSHSVGARPNGDLQIGWLRPSRTDPVERPVFLDAQHDGSSDQHRCAMYVDDPVQEGRVQYITKEFNPNPTLFVAGSEFLVQKLLIQPHERRDWADRFHLIEPPKSKITDWLATFDDQQKTAAADDESVLEVPPLAGTLVVFDSVTLPHEVLPTVDRERYATSGWMHEDQQRVETHPDYTV